MSDRMGDEELKLLNFIAYDILEPIGDCKFQHHDEQLLPLVRSALKEIARSREAEKRLKLDKDDFAITSIKLMNDTKKLEAENAELKQKFKDLSKYAVDQIIEADNLNLKRSQHAND